MRPHLTKHARDRIAQRKIPIGLIDRCFYEGVSIGPGNKPNTEKIALEEITIIIDIYTISVITAYWN